MDRRALLLSSIDLAQTVGAEIGPQDRPLVGKHEGTVLYVDHCGTEELRRRFADQPTVDLSRLQVDAVWGKETLRQALLRAAELPGTDTTTFLDYVLASHVIEHVPDFVGWLDEVHDTLRPTSPGGGVLRLAVPDKRYCFDILRTTTVLIDVLEAYALRRRRPSARCIIDWALNITKVDIQQAWRGEIDRAQLVRLNTLEGSLHLARDAEFNGGYHDVHCWVFTPASFADLCLELAKLDLIKFECEWLVDSPRDSFEFYVSMRPSADRSAIVTSWQVARDSLDNSKMPVGGL
jgi:SAM-dependent methyltransferase